MSRPFENIRILDFTRFFAGPYGTYQFALQGADVIKVEPLEGEDIRRAQLDPLWVERDMAPAFASVNANKRSIALDLRQPEAIDIILKLVKDVDIVWENFRPGVMQRLGLGYEELSKINPDLIYCAVTGFGQSGPEQKTAAFDGKIQALSGIMSITGDKNDGPMRAGFAVCDLVGGITAAFAVSTALYQRAQTGRGQFVDVAMLDATLNMLSQHVTEYTMTGRVPQQYGNLSVTRKVTADRFRCGDGHIVLAVLLEKQFINLLTTLGCQDALDDPRFKDWDSRTAHADALREVIETAMREGSPEEWEARLTAADVPCATIYSFDQVVRHPQVQHRELLQTVPSPYGPMTLVGAGFRLSESRWNIDCAPALVGEHTEEILKELGCDANDVNALIESKVVACGVLPVDAAAST